MALCYNRYYNYNYTCSGWETWGRWVLLGVIIFVFLVLFICCSCFSQRRRRKAGRQPFYGTGWTYNLPGGKPAAYGQNTNTSYQAPPPEYPTQQNNGYYAPNNGGGANQSYFGGRSDVEMQAPGSAYQPPVGPPPGKNY